MRVFLPILFASFLPFAAAREVVQLTWPTRHASPVPSLPKQTSDWLPAFRVALAALPESATVALSLVQPTILGVSSEDAAKMQPLIAKRYTAIASDSAFAKAASALPTVFQRSNRNRAWLPFISRIMPGPGRKRSSFFTATEEVSPDINTPSPKSFRTASSSPRPMAWRRPLCPIST